jgi:hypothetical protein
MTDHRIGPDLSNDVLDVLHRHGFPRDDDQHAGRAIFLIGDLARTSDQLAVQLLHDEQAAQNLRRQAEPHAPPSQPGLAADKEAGQ